MSKPVDDENLSWWKRVKRTRGYALTKRFLKRITGQDIWIRPEIKRNLKIYADEWVICPECLSDRPVVYSVGIGETLGFETEIIRDHDAEVHAFDPTPNTAEWITKQTLPEGMHFHRWALAETSGELRFFPRVRRSGKKSSTMFTLSEADGSSDEGITVTAKDLPTIMAELGHEAIDVLRMDIEGAEFAVLEALLNTSLRPPQILVEFHHRFAGIGNDKAREILAKLYDAGYRVTFVSSTGREVSFLRE